MLDTNQPDKRKIVLAVGVTGIAVAIMAGTWFWSQAQTAARDRANLQAQRRGGPGGMAPGGMGNPAEFRKRMLDRMTQELGLTPQQRTRIDAIQTAMMPPMPPPGQGGDDASREQRREQMRKTRDESNARIKEVLTPEQQTKYDAMQQEMRNRRGGPPGGGGPDGPGGPPPDGMGGPPPGMPPGDLPPSGSTTPTRP